MRVQEFGSGDRAVVLLHGIPRSGMVWRAVAEELARDHRVLVTDLLGFGESPRPASIDRLWTDRQAGALREALHAAGVERAVFAGHDFGGPVALALAQRPDAGQLIAGLGLAATNVFADTPIPLPIRAVTWPLIGALARRLLFSGPSLRMTLRRGSTRPLDPAVYLGDSGQQRCATAMIFAHALRDLASRYEFAAPILGQLDVPVLVGWGDHDPFFPVAQAERKATAARDARVVIYEGAGHFLPDERPEQLAADLRQLAQDGSQ